jgi:hypothetical protein
MNSRFNNHHIPTRNPVSSAVSHCLGNSAKSVSTVSVDKKTGEIFAPGTRDRAQTRKERFSLQTVAASILNGHRTAKCLRLAHSDYVAVWKSQVQNVAVFRGLQTCGSVWTCPVCAAKISERRRVEVNHAVNAHQASGGEVVLLTLTNPHELGDSLAECLDRQAKAMNRLYSSRKGRELFEEMGSIGTIRAYEITHGAHGWHPHFHIMIFVKSGLDLATYENRFYQVWANACKLSGLPVPSRRHGVKLDNGNKAASYASKWGMDSELTKGHIKKAKQEQGRTPFDLLRAYRDDDDRLAGQLFQEFAQCFKGRAQLFWSRGLKSRFNLASITDKQIMERIDDSAVLLGRFTREKWRVVVSMDLRLDVLILAENGGWSAVERLLDALPEEPPSHPSQERLKAGLRTLDGIEGNTLSYGQGWRKPTLIIQDNEAGSCNRVQ